MASFTNNFSKTVIEQLDGRAPRYCRTVLQYFHSHSTEVATVEDLVTFVRDRDQPEEDETEVTIHLHHATLPKMADAGLIEYDARSSMARYRGRSAEA